MGRKNPFQLFYSLLGSGSVILWNFLFSFCKQFIMIILLLLVVVQVFRIFCTPSSSPEYYVIVDFSIM